MVGIEHSGFRFLFKAIRGLHVFLLILEIYVFEVEFSALLFGSDTPIITLRLFLVILEIEIKTEKKEIKCKCHYSFETQKVSANLFFLFPGPE